MSKRRTQQRADSPDYTHMNPQELLEAGRDMYARLQKIFRAELSLPTPSWRNLETVSEQMTTLEQNAPEVTE